MCVIYDPLHHQIDKSYHSHSLPSEHQRKGEEHHNSHESRQHILHGCPCSTYLPGRGEVHPQALGKWVPILILKKKYSHYKHCPTHPHVTYNNNPSGLQYSQPVSPTYRHLTLSWIKPIWTTSFHSVPCPQYQTIPLNTTSFPLTSSQDTVAACALPWVLWQAGGARYDQDGGTL